MFGQQTGKWENYDSGLAHWWTQGVTQGPLLIKKVFHVLVKYIWGKTYSENRKGAWLSGNIFELLRADSGEIINYQVSTEDAVWIHIIVARNIWNTGVRKYVSGKGIRRS